MALPLILTRPRLQSVDYFGLVAANFPGKFTPVVSPLLHIRAEAADIDLDGVQALLFTSRNAVTQYVALTGRRDIPALCVGRATAELAAANGLSATSADGDAANLAALAAAGYIPDGGDMLLLRGAHTTVGLVESLAAEGIYCREQILYDQVTQPLTEEAKVALTQQSAIVPLFSTRTAIAFVDQISELSIFPPHYQVMSKSVGQALTGHGFASFKVAREPSAAGMLELLAAY